MCGRHSRQADIDVWLLFSQTLQFHPRHALLYICNLLPSLSPLWMDRVFDLALQPFMLSNKISSFWGTSYIKVFFSTPPTVLTVSQLGLGHCIVGLLQQLADSVAFVYVDSYLYL